MADVPADEYCGGDDPLRERPGSKDIGNSNKQW
jgi:hypothetical protein